MIQSKKYWTPEEFEVSSYQFRLSERINTTYDCSGSDTTHKCSYTYNELGFRGDSIYKDGFKVMSIGCSITEGVGVNNNETWPYYFCQLIPNSVNLNFGHGGRSNDYIARCLLTFYEKVKPDLVLIMYTESHRREFYTNNGGIEPFHHKPWGYFNETEDGIKEHDSLLNLSNNENDFQNWFKNHQLIKLFMENKKCNWLWNGWFATNELIDEFRFDGEYYPFIDYGVENVHPGPKTNQKYATDLYNYILNNHSNYFNKL